ncbi:MAG: FAD:protein FMN transferase [Bradyrhizobium sp.]|uniref:FAD:protein FMN transferase n=1 Tax=Bradyrhizobium sp. TaxID=376 RepID=UPI0025C0CD51|nr:FAD:protein FMN transferase [Bradyrhizobium sp.]MBI5263346.1 FAD:protein FMN transferase [Bradyrhizobium sp.]
MNRRKLISASLGLCSLAATARLAAWGKPLMEDSKPHTLSGRALGTKVSLLALHADADKAQAALAEALAEVQAVDALLSLYRDDSQLSMLNRAGVLESPDARVLDVLRYAQDLSGRTQGAFDVTVQPLWLAFSKAKERGGLPTPAALREARALVDWRRLTVSDDVVRLQLPGMAVTLNGVAQGYAADRALAALRRHGIAHALIDAGEFDTLGRKPNGGPWVLGVRHPRDVDAPAARLAMDGRALATSGDYETFFTPDFRHHHIFDPAVGDSPTELASATVLARTALEADGLSTAFMVLGAERSLALAAMLPGVDALLIGKNGECWRSPGLPALTA